MKTPEDEAFDELARKQGAWGGGFPAKRAMAADKLQEEDWGALAEKQLASIKRDTQASFEGAMVRATHKVMTELEAQPVQKPVAWVNHGENRITRVTGWDGYGALYAGPAPLPVQPVQEPVAWITPDGEGFRIRFSLPTNEVPLGWDALYTTPPKREWVGLTDEDRKAALLAAYKEWECEELLLCAREDYLLIEQALKEKNNG